jgi:hypothetical protein
MKKSIVDNIRAKSLLKTSSQAIAAAKDIELKEEKTNTILRELYVGLHQYCEAIGYLKGYKFELHEDITVFLRDNLKESAISFKFDKYRRLRNGIHYYGETVSIETVKEALEEIPNLILKLEKYTKKEVIR